MPEKKSQLSEKDKLDLKNSRIQFIEKHIDGVRKEEEFMRLKASIVKSNYEIDHFKHLHAQLNMVKKNADIQNEDRKKE